MLNGHIDVVPAGDEAGWTTPPWEATVRDGAVYGRGAVDMKGGLCCALAAAQGASATPGCRLRGRLIVASVVGEEDGGIGTLATIVRGHTRRRRRGRRAHALRVVPAQAGSLMFRLIVPRPRRPRLRARGGRERDGEVPAAVRGAPPARGGAVRRRRPARPRRPATPARLFAALSPAVADRSRHGPRRRLGVERARRRSSPRAGTASPSARIRPRRGGRSKRPWPARPRPIPGCAEHPPAVEWWGGRFDPAVTDPADPSSPPSPARRDGAGPAPPLEGVTYGADLRLLVNVGGIPTVLFGPGDVRVAHMPDEYVPVAELRAATEALVLTALRFCGVGE